MNKIEKNEELIKIKEDGVNNIKEILKNKLSNNAVIIDLEECKQFIKEVYSPHEANKYNQEIHPQSRKAQEKFPNGLLVYDLDRNLRSMRSSSELAISIKENIEKCKECECEFTIPFFELFTSLYDDFKQAYDGGNYQTVVDIYVDYDNLGIRYMKALVDNFDKPDFSDVPDIDY